MTAVPELGWLDVALALQLLVYPFVLGRSVGVPLGRTLAIGGARAFVQLSLLGWALRWMFAVDSPLLVLLGLALMVIVGADEARRRAKKKLPGELPLFALAIGAGALVTGATVLFVIVRPTPLLNPRAAIPVLGLVVGSSLTATTLASERLVSEFGLRRHEIETALALGASPAQASRAAVREAFRAAMIPPMNHLMVVGIVQIPGTMTGLVLAGHDPTQGALYQLVISYSIVTCAAVTSAVATHLAARRLFTERAQLRSDLLG